MGDHHAWQKESFYEVPVQVPFLLSWPEQITSHGERDDLVSLTDLFAIARHAAGKTDVRDGVDVLGTLKGTSPPREYLFGWYGQPVKPTFKVMVRHADWKYIYMSNGDVSSCST